MTPGSRRGVAESTAGASVSRLLLIMTASALLVTAVRVAAPLEVGKDQAVQLEAAQRMLQGFGLTTTADVVPLAADINEPPLPRPLTWWPPGLSILVAAFLRTGLSLASSLKILYAATTVAGWSGWTLLALEFFRQPLYYGWRACPVAVVMAAAMPLWFTPSWAGTDIFLWAGVPPLVFLLRQAGREPGGAKLAALAGLLFGSLCAMRYSSGFLGLAALLILVQVNAPRLRVLLKKAALFTLGAGVILVPLALYLASVREAGVLPVTGLYEHPIEASETQNVLTGATYASRLILGHSLLSGLITYISFPPLTYVVGGATLLLIMALPYAVWRIERPARLPPRGSISLALSFLPASLVLFLLGSSRGWFLGVPRYYLPLTLCGVLIAYRVAAGPTSRRLVSLASNGVVLFFLFYAGVYMPALGCLPATRDAVGIAVLGFPPSRLASQDASARAAFDSLFTRKQLSRAKVRELYEAHPHALYFVDSYPFFVFDGFPGGPRAGERLRDLPRKEYWQQAYISAPGKVFWIVDDESSVPTIPESLRRRIYDNRLEKTIIFESDFPSGYRFGFSGSGNGRRSSVPSTDRSPGRFATGGDCRSPGAE